MYFLTSFYSEPVRSRCYHCGCFREHPFDICRTSYRFKHNLCCRGDRRKFCAIHLHEFDGLLRFRHRSRTGTLEDGTQDKIIARSKIISAWNKSFSAKYKFSHFEWPHIRNPLIFPNSPSFFRKNPFHARIGNSRVRYYPKFSGWASKSPWIRCFSLTWFFLIVIFCASSSTRNGPNYQIGWYWHCHQCPICQKKTIFLQEMSVSRIPLEF